MKRMIRRLPAICMAAILLAGVCAPRSFASEAEEDAVAVQAETATPPEEETPVVVITQEDTPVAGEAATPQEDLEAATPPEDLEAATSPENLEAATLPEDPETATLPEDPEAAIVPEDLEAATVPEGLEAATLPEEQEAEAVEIVGPSSSLLQESASYYTEAELTRIEVSGVYDTTAKEAILKRLNEIRKEACDESLAWTQDKNGKPVRLSPSDYTELKWSSELEEAAIQRAAEATFVRQHWRPDESSCYSAYPASLTPKHWYHAENLAWNYSGIMEAIEQFYSEKKYLNEDGSSSFITGHYTNIINPDMTHTALSGFDPGNDQWTSVAMELIAKYGSQDIPEDKADVSALKTASVAVPASCVKAVIEGPDGIALGGAAKDYRVVYKTDIPYSTNSFYSSVTDTAAATLTSGKPEVVSVSGTKATAKAKGTATLTFQSADGKLSATKQIRVFTPVTGVTVTGNGTVLKGSSLKLAATVTPADADNKTVTWKSSRTYVASVSSDGTVTGVREGTTVITATTVGTGIDDKPREATFQVTVRTPVSEITLDEEKTEIAPDESYPLYAQVSPYNAYDRSVTWSSSNPAVATVKDGVVTAHKSGDAVITATSNGVTVSGKQVSASCKVHVPARNLVWSKKEDASYWYEGDVRQGTYDDMNGVRDAQGNIRGREIYDPESNGWYWLDAVYDGAKAVSKEVWMPYIYQEETTWSDDEKWKVARECGGMAQQVYDAMQSNGKRDESGMEDPKWGKWVRYDADGKMYKGWYTPGVGNEDHLNPEYIEKGQIGHTYYYDPITGLMAKGLTVIGGRRYFFDEVTGWLLW